MRRLRYLKPLIVFAVLALFGLVIMVLWNWLIPTIFGFTSINFGQAVGLFVLCRLLFGRISPGRHKKQDDGRFSSKKFRKMYQIRKKWRKMTPEQRKEFIRKREKSRKGNHPFFSEEPEDSTSEKPDNDDK